MKPDDGGKVCKGCPDSQPKLNPGLPTGNLSNDVNLTKTMGLPVEEQDKLIEALGLDPKEWAFGYLVEHKNGVWSFHVLLKNKLNSEQNVKAFAGKLG